jgi:hypothetical protein
MSQSAPKALDLTGGESVYCINETQLRQAHELVISDAESGRLVKETLAHLASTLTRNERAALAFVLIDELLRKED